MPRSNWKGFISFGLVSIPVVLYTSENTADKISFHEIDRRNNARIKFKRVNAENGKEVPWDDIVKGYEYSKDNIFVAGPDELKQIAGENTRAIALESFINMEEIEFIDVGKTYYLVPDKHGDKGYVILREALKKMNKVGIAKVILSTKEHLAALAVHDNALVLYLLRYSAEIRKPEEFDIPGNDLKKYKVTSKEVDTAKKLIQSMTTTWKPEKYKDEFKIAVQKWAEKKAKQMPVTAMKQRASASSGRKEVNFIDLLKQSLKSKNGKKPKKQTKTQIHTRTKNGSSKHATKH